MLFELIILIIDFIVYQKIEIIHGKVRKIITIYSLGTKGDLGAKEMVYRQSSVFLGKEIFILSQKLWYQTNNFF